MLDYANTNKMTLDKIKAELAGTAMKLDLQKDLFLASTTKELHAKGQPQVVTPAIEPPGRAPDGQAFAK